MYYKLRLYVLILAPPQFSTLCEQVYIGGYQTVKNGGSPIFFPDDLMTINITQILFLNIELEWTIHVMSKLNLLLLLVRMITRISQSAG